MPEKPNMNAPMVGSLIYSDHKIPKKYRPWSERWKIPTFVAVAFIVASILAYKFVNYRQERTVSQFLAEVSSGQIDAAFSQWDIEAGGSYSKQDFVSDWGKDGYYTKGMTSAKVIDSNRLGTAVTVYVEIDTQKVPIALLVDKETLKLSFATNNKYKARAR
jgi:hypothetical protein